MSWVGALLIVAGVYLLTNLLVRRIGLFSSALSAERLRELMARREAPIGLIDLRSAAAYATGHIPSAINIPYELIARRPPDVPRETLLVLCGESGLRASASRRHLARLGFPNVVNFGPVSRWDRQLAQGSDPGRMATSPPDSSGF